MDELDRPTVFSSGKKTHFEFGEKGSSQSCQYSFHLRNVPGTFAGLLTGDNAVKILDPVAWVAELGSPAMHASIGSPCTSGYSPVEMGL